MRSLTANSVQCALEFGAEQAVISLNALGTANHDVVGTGKPLDGHDLAGKRAKTALHSIANDGAANFLGDGDAHANGWIQILAVADQENEARRRHSLAGIGGKEVGALLDYA